MSDPGIVDELVCTMGDAMAEMAEDEAAFKELREMRRKLRAVEVNEGHVPMYPGGVFSMTARREYGQRLQHAQQANEFRQEHDLVSWDGLLLELCFSALAEPDDEIREEFFIKLAAYAIAACQASRRDRFSAPCGSLA